ncbi:tubulin monoglutamylase TTLL4-like [Corticium candelabrum]|uniref:tubulin monoglutamylase TTLL4-like n=1 Tax=Corticium candelabrum TaxID=121492 RepID=UPI002E266C6F|nr:tubulin monoglutamylase TTLL4-like [Corticium candelabrum]
MTQPPPMDFYRVSLRGAPKGSFTLGDKHKQSKLHMNPIIMEFDGIQPFRNTRGVVTTTGMCKPHEIRSRLDRSTADVSASKSTDPRDGSDPTFAAALCKRLSNLSSLSLRDESPSSGFFSRSSASDDCGVLEEDEESGRDAAVKAESEVESGEDSDCLDDLSDEEWVGIDSPQKQQDGTESERTITPSLPSLSTSSKKQFLYKTLDKQAHTQETLCPGAYTTSSHSIETVDSALFERPSSLLTPSLFPKCPPTIHFATADETIEFVSMATKRLLKWRMSPITPNVIKNCIKRSGFTPAKRGDIWLGYWGKHMKSPAFKSIREYQKINHFPGSFQIGRKDHLSRNLSRMQHRHGRTEFGFFPQTFILPYDYTQLKQEFEKGGKQKWIVKPPASARGIGVRVIGKWSQVPTKRPAIVQRYLDKPFLINQSKFDLRVYVYVSSYDPLRIYVFDDGLARFATCKYSSATKSLSNRFMHLTNYSVNKRNSAFTPNSDETACQGHKWGLQAFWRYMRTRGIDVDGLWELIKDVIVKTVISSESSVSSLMKANVHNRWCCHELFGFDIMLDEHLKPWVLEVNISPSLHSNSLLDENIKGHMVRDLLNMARFHLPTERKSVEKARQTATAAARVRSGGLTPDERAKHVFYIQKHLDEAVRLSILTTLTPDDVRILMETEDELSICGRFERVFPTPKSRRYLKFFDTTRYYNILLDEWTRHYRHCVESGVKRLVAYAEKGVHLGATSDAEHQWSKSDVEPPTSTRRSLSAPSGVSSSRPTRPKSSKDMNGVASCAPGLPRILSKGRKSVSGNKGTTSMSKSKVV